MTPEQWTEFVSDAMPALTGGLLALATAIFAFVLNERAAGKRRLRERQDAAIEHIMDMFGRMQRAEEDVYDVHAVGRLVDELVDSLLRFTWLLDGRDEIVTQWVNAMGLDTVQGLKTAENRPEWVGTQKTKVVLKLRDWRVRPVRTRRLMQRDFETAELPTLSRD